MTPPKPSRGEIWFLNLDPAQGHEQSGSRPALVVSVDPFNHGPADMVVVLPVTSKAKGIPFHVSVPPEGGVRRLSFVKCEGVSSVSRSRLQQRWGTVRPDTLAAVEDRLRILLGLCMSPYTMDLLPTSPGGDLLTRLISQAEDSFRASRAGSTRRAYEHDWKQFRVWCDDNRLVPLPASEQTVILYSTDLTKNHGRKWNTLSAG